MNQAKTRADQAVGSPTSVRKTADAVLVSAAANAALDETLVDYGKRAKREIAQTYAWALRQRLASKSGTS